MLQLKKRITLILKTQTLKEKKMLKILKNNQKKQIKLMTKKMLKRFSKILYYLENY